MIAFWAIFGFALLLLGSGVSAYAKLTLINRYRFEEYLSDPRARRLYWAARIAGVVLAVGLIVLGVCSGLWWVAIPLFAFAAFALYRNSWGLWMRYTLRHAQFYRERGWR